MTAIAEARGVLVKFGSHFSFAQDRKRDWKFKCPRDMSGYQRRDDAEQKSTFDTYCCMREVEVELSIEDKVSAR